MHGISDRDVWRHAGSEGRRRQTRTATRFDKEDIARAAGLFGWTLAVGITLGAIYHVGGFAVLFGEPRAGVTQSEGQFRPGINFRPASGPADGCTQAAIDRSTGVATQANCQVLPAGTVTLTADLTKPSPAR